MGRVFRKGDDLLLTQFAGVYVETQADLSAMNDNYVWAKEVPARRMSAQYAVGPCFGGAGKGERLCGWQLGGGRICQSGGFGRDSWQDVA